MIAYRRWENGRMGSEVIRCWRVGKSRELREKRSSFGGEKKEGVAKL